MNDTIGITPLGGRHSSARINYLAKMIDARTYLEIGVRKGKTYVNIDIPFKVGVDPLFLFDYEKYSNDDSLLLQITSDEFFVRNERLFDIIFLDGLHTFEQTFRDFCSSLRFSHNRTVWVIDDTNPSDIYSANKDQSEAVATRKAFGGRGGAWHGDVYKTIFAINDFFPTHNWKTTSTGDNGQTVVWAEARQNFRPRFNSLEDISRMDFFQFRRELNIMNFDTAENCFDAAAAHANKHMYPRL